MGNARTKSRYPPRDLNLVIGAISNTDLERSYIRGANDPRHLGIVLVEGEQGRLLAFQAGRVAACWQALEGAAWRHTS